MSFDLYFFPAPGPADLEEVYGLLDAEEPAGVEIPLPGAEMAGFIAELERRWPGFEDDAPWASWPLDALPGGGLGVNLVWSQADAVARQLLALAGQFRLTTYDPQEDRLIPPPGEGRGSRFFGRRR